MTLPYRQDDGNVRAPALSRAVCVVVQVVAVGRVRWWSFYRQSCVSARRIVINLGAEFCQLHFPSCPIFRIYTAHTQLCQRDPPSALLPWETCPPASDRVSLLVWRLSSGTFFFGKRAHCGCVFRSLTSLRTFGPISLRIIDVVASASLAEFSIFS